MFSPPLTAGKSELNTCISHKENNVTGSEIKSKIDNLLNFQRQQNSRFSKELCMQINLEILLTLNSILLKDLVLMAVMHSSQE